MLALAPFLTFLLQASPPEELLAPFHARVAHLRERIECPEPGVRQKVLRELTLFVQRDSRAYPPLFRFLLADPAPEIAWEALVRLDAHGQLVAAPDLPRVLEVPLVGRLIPGEEASVHDLREIAASGGARGGWAIKALGLIGDRESLSHALALAEDPNLFARHEAAVALLHLGQVEAGRARLRTIAADFHADGSHWYSVLAAERLVRLGEERYLGALIALLPLRVDRIEDASILEDLTGEFRTTEVGWRDWWRERGGIEFHPEPARR